MRAAAGACWWGSRSRSASDLALGARRCCAGAGGARAPSARSAWPPSPLPRWRTWCSAPAARATRCRAGGGRAGSRCTRAAHAARHRLRGHPAARRPPSRRTRATKAAPRRLARDEKPLYDLGQRLRAAVETNREEGERAQAGDRDRALPDGGGPSLAAPVERGRRGGRHGAAGDAGAARARAAVEAPVLLAFAAAARGVRRSCSCSRCRASGVALRGGGGRSFAGGPGRLRPLLAARAGRRAARLAEARGGPALAAQVEQAQAARRRAAASRRSRRSAAAPGTRTFRQPLGLLDAHRRGDDAGKLGDAQRAGPATARPAALLGVLALAAAALRRPGLRCTARRRRWCEYRAGLRLRRAGAWSACWCWSSSRSSTASRCRSPTPTSTTPTSRLPEIWVGLQNYVGHPRRLQHRADARRTAGRLQLPELLLDAAASPSSGRSPTWPSASRSGCCSR